MVPEMTRLQIRCLFQLGTPPQPFAVVQDSVTGRTAIVRITSEIFDFLSGAGIETCEPTSIPPGSLVGMNILCVFSMFIGAQQPIPYAVTESIETGMISIFQISTAAFNFLRFLGIPTCPIVNAPGVQA